jgi:hypothetical protein
MTHGSPTFVLGCKQLLSPTSHVSFARMGAVALFARSRRALSMRSLQRLVSRFAGPAWFHLVQMAPL